MSHAHFLCAFSLYDVQTRTRMAQGVCSAHVISLHLTLSIVMFHPPSLLFPHGHFDTSFPSAPSLPNCSRSESSGHAHFRATGEEFGCLADPTHSTESEAICYQHTTAGDCSSKRGNETYQGGGGAKHEEDGTWELFCITHLFINHHQECIVRNPFRRQKKVDLLSQTLRPAEGNPWEHVPSTSIALSDTRSVADVSTSKRKESDNFEFEPWPRASKISSWKVSFRREVRSGSTHSRLISDCFAEIDLAAGMEELDYSEFIFDKHQVEFENSGFKDCHRNHDGSSGRSQEKDQSLGGSPIQRQSVQC